VSVDLVPAPRPPAVAAGRHLVVVELGERRRALYVDVRENRATDVHVELLPAPAERWAGVRAVVQTWRRGAEPDATAVAALAGAAGLGVVFIVRGADVDVWTITGGTARPAGRASARAPEAVLAVLPGPEPAPAPAPAPEPKRQGRSPWLYVIAAGAAAAAVGLVILASSGSATQRIEVRWP
jgi:hypothetical protein